jgi:hypothetical protein
MKPRGLRGFFGFGKFITLYKSKSMLSSRCIFIFGILVLILGCLPHSKPKELASIVKHTTLIEKDSVKKVIIKESDLEKLVNELNMRLSLYDSIASMSGYSKTELEKFKLSKADRDSLLLNINSEDQKVQGWQVADTYQVIVNDLLKKILSHPSIGNYQLGDILNIGVTTSDDGKLFNLVLPENTGGTYQSALSWIHYRAHGGKVYNYYPEKLIKENDSVDEPAFNRDGFSKIITIKSKEGIKYLMQGSVIGCTTCIGEYIELGHFYNGKAITDFSYSIGTRMGDEDGAINYDDKTQTITVKHHPAEYEQDECNCKTDAQRFHDEDHHYMPDSLMTNDNNIKRGKSLVCVFKFNGTNFILNKRKSRLPGD